MEQYITGINDFSITANDEQIDCTARALEANGFHVIIAENKEQARQQFFSLIPPGAQIHQGSSRTLDDLGITQEIEESGKYNAIRPKTRSMDRQTQADEIRRLGASPDYMAGSVHAITEDGHVLVASAVGSQLGPYAYGAGKVIWVAGSQKIVKNIEMGFRRIEQYVFALEDERMFKLINMHSSLNKIMIFNKERPGRINIIIVKEKLGF